jgi:thiamine-phosphate pyrophosphorylase
VVIGGITPDNCGPLVEAGADFLAVSGAVWGGDEVAAIAGFAKAIKRA